MGLKAAEADSKGTAGVSATEFALSPGQAMESLAGYTVQRRDGLQFAFQKSYLDGRRVLGGRVRRKLEAAKCPGFGDVQERMPRPGKRTVAAWKRVRWIQEAIRKLDGMN